MVPTPIVWMTAGLLADGWSPCSPTHTGHTISRPSFVNHRAGKLSTSRMTFRSFRRMGEGMMAAVRNVLVVGGGIGGLTAGVALRQAGIAVDLIEINPSFSVYGVGI